MRRNARSPVTYPSWATLLETPVWITGPDRTLVWLNESAASLLGVPPSECLGRPCHEIVRGCDEDGRLICAAECPRWRGAALGRAIAPVRLSVGAEKAPRRWTHILLIPVRRGGGTWLVHCAVSAEREIRMESYLRHVATRWAGYRPLRDGGRSRDLTAREREILERLAADEDLHAIAGALGISYITVRNHVQHILRKLAVRSIAEAVASSILSNGEESDDLTPGVSPAAPPPSRAPGRHSLLKAR